MRARCAEGITGQDYYGRLRESGIHYGAFLQSIAQLWRNDGDVLGDLRVPDGPDAEFAASQIHPAILDAGLQVFGAAVAAELPESDRRGIHLPTRIEQFRVHGPAGRRLWSRTRVRLREPDALTGDVHLLDDGGRMAVEIQGLRFEHLGEGTPRAAGKSPDDWLYEFQWQPKALAPGQPSVAAGGASWLIFADGGGVADALSALLEARGERSILATAADSYEQMDDAHYRIRPDRPEDIHRLLEGVLQSDRLRCRGIVHLWSLDAASPEATTVASLKAAQTLGCGSALLLAQELARLESPDPPRVWLITRGAQAAGEESSSLSIAQSPMWGLGRVVAQEHPTFWGGLVDLEPRAAPRDRHAAEQLWDEIAAGDGEDQLAFRHGRRYVGRLVRWHPSAKGVPPLRWRTDASYLISGGLGDLGLRVAALDGRARGRDDWTSRRAHRAPATLRSWSSVERGSRLARRIAAIRELESSGASVHLAAVDVADEAELGRFFDSFAAEGWPAIRGVVHAAGVLEDGLLAQLDVAEKAGRARSSEDPKCWAAGCSTTCSMTVSSTSSCSSPPRVPCWASPVRGTTPPRTPSWMPWRITGMLRASRP